MFPAAILQPPFFDPDADPAVNYGGIGGENIGDVGGLTVAHCAYQLSLAGKPAPAIDGYSGVVRTSTPGMPPST